MRAMICGGGIGGLALAGGLSRDGWDVTVLERDLGPSTSGAAVTLFANGLAALDRLGVDGAERLGGEIKTMEFRSADGRKISRLDLTVMDRVTGFGVRTVPRRDLVEHLSRSLGSAEIRFGRAAAEVAPDGSSVVDASGEVYRADLVVGADGARSVVRSATVGRETARPVGWSTWQGLDPVLPDIAAGTTGLCQVGAAGLVGLMPAGNGLLQWWFDARGDGDFDAICETFAGYAEPVPELMQSVTDVYRFEHHVHEIPDHWGRGTSTLIGDAAHVFPPSQAQGANQALEDAWSVARNLARIPDTVTALRRSESERVPRVRRVSKLAAAEVTNRPPSPAMRTIARMTPPTITGRAWLSAIKKYSNVLTDKDDR